MQALMSPKVKSKFDRFDYSTYEVKEKSNNSKLGLVFRFYQKLFVIIFISFAFLIFPESPKDSEVLCKTYHSKEACNIW